MTNIKIIAGSTRPGRFNIQPATWIYTLAQAYTATHPDIHVELLDLEQFNLPLLDESQPASNGVYEHEHTKAWAAKIADADAFIIVTPEYNHSVPGALKNAIDFLSAEWENKPVSFISYGGLAGGSRSVEHLRGIAGELHMFDLRNQIMFPNYWGDLNEKGEYQFNDRHAKSGESMIKELAFWGEVMKSAREKLQAEKK